MNAETATPALYAEALCKAFGRGESKTQVLDELSLKLPCGAFEAIMGPSGCGKSTLLHILAGLVAPDSGRVEIGGRCITRMTDGAATRFRRRHIGVVFQSYNLVETLDVAANITLPVALDGGRPDKARLESLLEKLGLGGKGRRRPSQLSGGERQRVAIARALFARPDVILADEPTGNLDIPASRSICSLLKQLHEEENCTILLVTHDPMVAATAESVRFMRSGIMSEAFDPAGDPAAVSSKYLESCL